MAPQKNRAPIGILIGRSDFPNKMPELLRAIETHFKLTASFEPASGSIRIFLPQASDAEIDLPGRISSFISGWDAHIRTFANGNGLKLT